MNSNSVTGSSSTLNDLISKVLDRFDTNKDGQLSTTEFGDFLSGVLGSRAATSATLATDHATAVKTGGGEHRGSLAGFDGNKIDDPSLPGARTMKYTAARIFQDFKPMPENLPAIIERLRAEGIQATQVSFDKIDFGDGFGPIDVIQGAYPGGGVAWQWMPQNG